MPSLLSRYATPLITGLFIVSLVSGVALFFHIGGATFHGMHEWLSMVLIAPFVLHLWKNWRPFLNHFKRVPMTVALALSLAACLPFAYAAMSAGGGGSPQRVVFQAIENGSVADVAPLFGHDGESLMAELRAKGLTVAGTGDKVKGVAEASGMDAFEVIGVIASAGK